MLHKGIGLTEPVEVQELHQGIIIVQGVPKHIEAPHHRGTLTKDLRKEAAIIQDPLTQVQAGLVGQLGAVAGVAPEVLGTYAVQGEVAPEVLAMSEVPAAVAPEVLEV
ncbi:hypothetical protein SB49_07760 [Sediminicola sp. YIK13]|nr:hypothetical protein SB49_07760 [Sediminicola sp. YIK13]